MERHKAVVQSLRENVFDDFRSEARMYCKTLRKAYIKLLSRLALNSG